MVPISPPGIWAATQTVSSTYRWVPASPQSVSHYFLVVQKNADGTLSAIIRNPEENGGAFFGTRTVAVSGNTLQFKREHRPDVTGTFNGDGTLVLTALSQGDAPLQFHRATPADLRWFYPSASPHWRYQPPRALHDGWRTGTLSSAGMRVQPITALMNGIVADRTPSLRSPYIQSVTIERHGRIVLDQYFYGFDPEYLHDVRSAGKSVTTLIVGRAIGDTHAFTPESAVLPLLPQYQPVKNDDARKQKMTVANLMTMASGLACDDNDDSSPGNEDTMQSQPAGTDWYRYTLDLPMLSEPGTRALYCGAGINLLGAIVQTQTHIPLDRYFADRFARPMQFGSYAMWLMPPPANAAYMAGGDRFRPRDFLKFGALLLNHGTWNGHRVLDADWLRQSIAPRTAPEGEGDRYGYGWHLNTLDVDGRRYDIVNAGGNGGQLLIVIPAVDAAVMVTAGNYNQYPVWRTFLPQIATAAIRSCSPK